MTGGVSPREVRSRLRQAFAGRSCSGTSARRWRGCFVALNPGWGFAEVRRNDRPSSDSDAWLRRTNPPDYSHRHLTLRFARNLHAGDTVLLAAPPEANLVAVPQAGELRAGAAQDTASLAARTGSSFTGGGRGGPGPGPGRPGRR